MALVPRLLPPFDNNQYLRYITLCSRLRRYSGEQILSFAKGLDYNLKHHTIDSAMVVATADVAMEVVEASNDPNILKQRFRAERAQWLANDFGHREAISRSKLDQTDEGGEEEEETGRLEELFGEYCEDCVPVQ